MEPENGGLEDDFAFQLDDFYIFRFHVNFQGCTLPKINISSVGGMPKQKDRLPTLIFQGFCF